MVWGSYPVQAQAQLCPLMAWKVLRHGGRSCDDWRTVYEGNDLAKAQSRFDTLAKQLRQGGVRLVNTEGDVVVRGVWSPRLRTRW